MGWELGFLGCIEKRCLMPFVGSGALGVWKRGNNVRFRMAKFAARLVGWKQNMMAVQLLQKVQSL